MCACLCAEDTHIHHTCKTHATHNIYNTCTHNMYTHGAQGMHTHTHTLTGKETHSGQAAPTAHPRVRSHTQQRRTQNVRASRLWVLWVRRSGQMISIPFLREAVPHTMRNALRNLLFCFQETDLSNGHDCRCQMGCPMTHASLRGSALKIPWQS